MSHPTDSMETSRPGGICDSLPMHRGDSRKASLKEGPWSSRAGPGFVVPWPSGSRRDALAGLGARIAFISTSFLIATPSPIAPLWGGRVSGSAWEGAGIAMGWTAMAVFLHRKTKSDGRELPEDQTWTGLALLVDVVALSLLLSLSGAAQNPFTMLYFVPITLATVLARAWTWRVVLLSVVMFALLLAQTARQLAPHRGHLHHEHFFQHVQGMAIALAVAGAFIVFFVLRVARALAQQRSHIQALSRAEQEGRFTVALGALSAGAAHELGSPLGTLQLLAEELPYLDSREAEEATRTMQAEVSRMKTILHGMQSSELSADALVGIEPWSLGDLALHLGTVAAAQPVWTIEVDEAAATTQPPKIVQQILRELLRNAQEAKPKSPIEVRAFVEATRLCLQVKDDGRGMTPTQLVEACAPFVSHRGSTGMGLFLATVHARQLGGELTLQSMRGVGTVAKLSLPLHFSMSHPHAPSAEGIVP